MRNRFKSRLEELRQQLQAGQLELQQLQGREAYLRETLLRISGAIQVLEEMLMDEVAGSQDSEALHIDSTSSSNSE